MAIQSFEKVPTAIDDQKFSTETTKPEMMQHFGKIKKDYGNNSNEVDRQNCTCIVNTFYPI